MTEQQIQSNIQRGKALKAMRQMMNSRQRNIAAMLKINPGNYSKMESGILNISDERLAVVKNVFDMFRRTEINRLKNRIKELEQFELWHKEVLNIEQKAQGSVASKAK